MTANATIRRADMTDIPELARVMARAFHHDPVSAWLIPDNADRALRQPVFFRIFLEHAIACGQVHTTPDREAVALWLDVDPDIGIRSGTEAGALFRAALGPNYERFIMLDKQMQAAHPTQVRHAFLPFIAVLPEEQGQGYGRALMAHKLAQLDATGTPVYLECSNPRSGRLYNRLGFLRLLRDIQIPDGPTLYPMWRRVPGHPNGSPNRHST